MRYHYTHIKMTRIQNTDNNKCFWRCGATGALTHCWWERKMVQPLWKTVWWLLTKLSILLAWVSVSVLAAQSCPTWCNPRDCSPPGSSVHGILQARILEWVAVPFFRRFPDPGIESRSPAFQADSLPSEPPGKPNSYRTIKQMNWQLCSKPVRRWLWYFIHNCQNLKVTKISFSRWMKK